ncbi:MAG: FAD-binding protein [Haliea sp.]|nr:FAD-binding protein [Haliea sp.]
MTATAVELNDISKLNPVSVQKVVVPRSVQEIQQAVASTSGPISIGGARCSMGGQPFCRDSLHLDMRELNGILAFSPESREISVQCGATWRQIQEHIDPHDLSVKIMQTYANFTVGGSLSVNVHGRYVGLGPLVQSVKSLLIVLVDGTVHEVSTTENPQLFFAAIGGYGGLGIIVEATLQLEGNFAVSRSTVRLKREDYLEFFNNRVGNNRDAIFHNADLYPPHYDTMTAVTWERTGQQVTVKRRLQDPQRRHLLQRFFMHDITSRKYGKWRREYLLDPLIYLRKKVHWKNYEASYDVAELQPISDDGGTFLLQEYFVPVATFDDFADRLKQILINYDANVVNISVRHATGDPGTYLAWAREDVFAFVLYHKQGNTPADANRTGAWTRELTSAAIECGGSYYLPYQNHATAEQFSRAYPRAGEFFALKRVLDPKSRLRNVLWDKYNPTESEEPERHGPSEFRNVLGNTHWADRLYRFLQVVFTLYESEKLFTLLDTAARRFTDDESIYKHVLAQLPQIRPKRQLTRHVLPAIRKQKQVLAGQTKSILRDAGIVNGYLEIGSTGFYVGELQKHLMLKPPLLVMDQQAPGYTPADIVKRGRVRQYGTFIDLDDYAPISSSAIGDSSLELVTCYIGLHHCPPDRLPAFLRSIARILKSGGVLVLREHDVGSREMAEFVSVIHSVFNAGTEETWEFNNREERHFNTLGFWVEAIERHGFIDMGNRICQDRDPTANTLLVFRRV